MSPGQYDISNMPQSYFVPRNGQRRADIRRVDGMAFSEYSNQSVAQQQPLLSIAELRPRLINGVCSRRRTQAEPVEVVRSRGWVAFYAIQFCSLSLGTRSNSRVLLLTSVTPSVSACAAIHRSLLPMGVPARFSFTRRRP